MPAVDDFQSYSPGMESPVAHAVAITPSDTADLTRLTRAIYVGGAGDLRIDLADGSTVTFVGMPVGWHPIRVARVRATGTTATDIVGCW
ncbi:spike base protein, RCAP_Rcc01079 family [Puniceibacterium sediminis]|uniref:Uncharacterized protein n=1 Tax=Puniceibacterium sediminis TaxID=1608407 RepID=A0A238YLG7_9RHOB|nr:hypothetical protein [Puniceibacterium sediminis]SNR72005.1 hypothetical protein SAMN06265370_11824 [Puniceibacterium sediminis]